MEKKKQEAKKAQTPCLPRQAPTPSPICLLLEAIDHIRVGSYYELDHAKLPPSTTPKHLKKIRVVMVSEKGALKVAVRFPSLHSLHTHITQKGYLKPEAKRIPALIEKHLISSATASEALYRRIPPLEIAQHSHIWSFWATNVGVGPSATASRSCSLSPALSGAGDEEEAMDSSRVVSKKSPPCWQEMKLAGLVKWGQRRKVRYLRRHEPTSDEEEEEKTETAFGKELKTEEEKEYGGDDEFHVDGGYCEAEDDDGFEDEEEEDMKTEEAEPLTKMSLRKRKRPPPVRKPKISQKKNSPKRPKPNHPMVAVVPEQSSEKLTVARWSAGRYKLAEENMLKVMKAKEATVGNPILRPALRSEARKLIGDTGLLDHLLKHLAGKVAPGGTERFRRRHNADGAMEYWLESADLVDIRKEAGVQDSYWTPPPGWMPGDNPTRDPTFARQIKELQDEITMLKRDLQENYVPKKQENGLAMVTTTSSSCLTSLDWDNDPPFSHQKERYAELMIKKAKMEEQLMEVSHSMFGMQDMYAELTIKKATIDQKLREVARSLTGMEEQLGMVKSSMEEPVNNSEAQISPPPISDNDQRETTETMRLKDKFASPKPKGKEHEEEEDKAAKIERLRRGFRICRAQGPFLWPNMSMSTETLVPPQQDDFFKVPTPPSVSSSSSATHHLQIALDLSQPAHGPTEPASPPVKPVAERRPVNTKTVCKVTTKPPSASPTPSILSAKSTNTKTLLNLNELPHPIPQPQSQNNSCDPPTSTTTLSLGSSRTLTYQRRHYQNSANMPRMLIKAKKEDEDEDEDDDDDDDDARKESNPEPGQQKQRWCSSTWMEEKGWLA